MEFFILFQKFFSTIVILYLSEPLCLIEKTEAHVVVATFGLGFLLLFHLLRCSGFYKINNVKDC